MTRNGVTYSRKQYALRAVRATGTFTMTAFEAFVLAEILYYYLHNGTQTLHGAAGDWMQACRDRAMLAREARATLRNIQDLPEQ